MDACESITGSRRRIAVAMSGGVDSSTAAALLKREGYDLVGFSMQLWDQKRNAPGADPGSGRCCSIEDLYDARAVAARLEIPYYVVNFQKEFETRVVKSFIQSYRDGYTPSPCVLCNSHMKFDHLVQMAEEVEAAFVATGHYARVGRDFSTGRYVLRRAKDAIKDQSYYLFELSQGQLARAMFPLGELDKVEVRQIARECGLEVADKAESQEICFVPDGDYAGFIERHYGDVLGDDARPHPFPAGEIVDTEGRVLGTHNGIHHYTVGQRRGLGIAHATPLYVIELRPDEGKVVVGERSALGSTSCRLVRINWVSIAEPPGRIRVCAKIRSRHTPAPATVVPQEDGSVHVVFDSPQPAITPGQACVFYDEDRVAGGGWIARGQDA